MRPCRRPSLIPLPFPLRRFPTEKATRGERQRRNNSGIEASRVIKLYYAESRGGGGGGHGSEQRRRHSVVFLRHIVKTQ